MRVCLVYLCILAATFASIQVESKPHGKHHGLPKVLTKDKDAIKEESNKPRTSDTLTPLEDVSQDEEDEELSSEGNIDGSKDDGKLAKREESAPVLLSEKELVDLLENDAQDEQEEEDEDEEDDEDVDEQEEADDEEDDEEEEEDKDEKVDKGVARSVGEEETSPDKVDGEVINVENAKSDDLDDEEEEKKEMKGFPTDKDEQKAVMDEPDDSTDPKIQTDLDHTASPTDGASKPVEAVSAQVQPQNTAQPGDSKPSMEEKPAAGASDGFVEDVQNTEAADSGNDSYPNIDSIQTQSSTEGETRPFDKEEERRADESGGHAKRKMRNQKKNVRTKKHSVQKDEGHPEPSQAQHTPKDSEGGSDSLPQKTKRRRAGKGGSLVGVNPVQIRATVDLYPKSRPSYSTGAHLSKNSADPCDHFRCKRGKTCKLDSDDKPSCVCQQPSECPTSVSEFDRVCGTDNRTYDTSCELFATKCNLEGTKKGHRLHLDYTGACKLIPQCVDSELVQFPLRMRDWLKNVLLQLYQHDSVSPGFLTSKQRFRAKKIFESERRLEAGDHSAELLAQDFEKNYNMYIYPVHWQFAQLDQHPSDRYLTHSELAPLRIPLVPMEHCTSRFFQECDADKDKQVSFKEWTTCFGIKDEDMDENLLF